MSIKEIINGISSKRKADFLHGVRLLSAFTRHHALETARAIG
jgi:hypothetical protein